MQTKYRRLQKRILDKTITAARLKPGECAVVTSTLPGNKVQANEVIFGAEERGRGRPSKLVTVLRKLGGTGKCLSHTPVRRMCHKALIASLS